MRAWAWAWAGNGGGEGIGTTNSDGVIEKGVHDALTTKGYYYFSILKLSAKRDQII